MENNRYDLISVIVPIYKVEKYIIRCINSIIGQTYTNLEIILVDDGSPDNCPSICDEYAKKDSRIVVIHKTNGGLSDARNCGIEKATGKYIAFIDSDDYIHPDMIAKLYKSITERDADIALCNFEYVDEADGIIHKESPIKNETLSSYEILKKLQEQFNWYYVVAWNKLYKKQLFDNIRFPFGKINEDEFVIHELFYICKTVAVIEDKLYMYLQRNNSIMHNEMSIKNFDAFEAFYLRYLFYKKNNLAEFNNKLEDKTWYKYATVRGQYKPHDKIEKDRLTQIDRMVKDMHSDCCKNKNLKYYLYMISPKIYFGVKNMIGNILGNVIKGKR